MKILIPVDGSTYTHKMLAYLLEHPELFASEHQYTVLHCVTPVPARASTMLGADVVRQYQDEEASKVMDPVREIFRNQRLSVEFQALTGYPADTITDRAREGGFDLIVMGSQGRGELASVVLGSVTTRVLARCSTPVLIIR